MTAQSAVVVFARALELGRVKTRLAATMGDAAALEVYRFLASRVIVAAREVADTRILVRCAPDNATEAVSKWLSVPAEPQGDGDLGHRMERAIVDHLSAGMASVVIIGTDAPDVDAHLMQEALRALHAHDVVFGPAFDGGYYLVGARRPVPELFREVPWSSPDTLAASLAKAAAAGYTVAMLPPLTDIDTEEDWREWCARSGVVLET